MVTIYGNPPTGPRQQFAECESLNEAEDALDMAENHGWTNLKALLFSQEVACGHFEAGVLDKAG